MEIFIRSILVIGGIVLVFYPIWGILLAFKIEDEITNELAAAIMLGSILVWATIVGILDVFAVVITSATLSNPTLQLSTEIPRTIIEAQPFLQALLGITLIGNLTAAGIALHQHDQGKDVTLGQVYKWTFLTPFVIGVSGLVIYLLIRFILALAGIP